MSEEQQENDYLALITGLGAVSEDRLNGIGVYTFQQLMVTPSPLLAVTARRDKSIVDGWKAEIKRLGLVPNE